MKPLNFVLLFCLLFFNCSGQNKQKSDENTIKPDENIKVNKEYDEFGNLIKYDSIYSYSYSSNSKLQDSLKQKFQQHFNTHSFFNDSFFDNFFKPDSLSGNFNPDDFFNNGFMNHDGQIKNMMQRMDSIQKLFFNQYQGNFLPVEPKAEDQEKI
jgi:hypothetical protein